MRVQGFRRLAASLLLGRIAGRMLAVGFVLFVLSRYHSPQLAGAATALLLLPGLLLSPIAGALLDRYGRGWLITVDYTLVALILFAMAGLSYAHALSPTVLLVLCAVASLTTPLSAAGARSFFPTLVPGHLWERANAIDSGVDVLATIVGSPAAGVLVAFAGGEWALAATAALYLTAGAAMVGVRDPGVKQGASGVLRDAWAGFLYVVRNRSLAGLAGTFFAFTVGWGCLVIAIPVLVLGRLHQGPATVGYIWGALGVVGFLSTLVAGRLNTRGRERQLMAGSMFAIALVVATLPVASSVWMVTAVMIAVALVETPFDISFLTLRQRRTDPARFGRAFAVSMSLNQVGTPLGAALAGPLISWSLNIALLTGAVGCAVAAFASILLIPAKDEP